MKTSKLTILKYVSFSILGLGLALSSCKKEDPVTDPDPVETFPAYTHKMQKTPILYKHTGETCYYCGEWGWPLWTEASDLSVGKAFCWGNYGSGYSNGHFRAQELNSSNSTQEAFQANFGTGGKPQFRLNGAQITLTGATISDAANNIMKDVEAMNADTDVDMTAALDSKWDGDKLIVKAQAKLHKDLTGEYHMGAYVVENKARGDQSGPNGGTNVEHHYVMRGSMSSAVWGEELYNGSQTSGDKFEKSFEVVIPSTYNKDHISVGVIIWKKNGTKYVVVNSATNQ